MALQADPWEVAIAGLVASDSEVLRAPVAGDWFHAVPTALAAAAPTRRRGRRTAG